MEYTGYEDEIIQKIEAGNVALPLQSSLITGSQTLFGVKTELQFGRLRVTTVFSQEKGEKKEINVSGGAQVQEFEKSAAQYEENRHFFLSHLFREEYERNLSSPPRVTSRINITAVEVYITNTQAAFNNTRNVLGFTDLGNDRRVYNTNAVQVNAGARVADNASNNLYANLTGGYPNAQQIRNFNNSDQVLQSQGLESGSDYERLENAILLSPNEYTLNAQLGYISLNRTLNPQDVLAVSYRYTYNGQVYQVGDLSVDGVDGQQALYLKLLKGTIINPSLPSWDLMMKNVYSLDAFNIGPNNFEFQIWYLNGETGVEIPYFPEGNKANTPLISVLGLDRISVVNDPQPDGVFDFIPNVTINPQNGKIYFPVLEPFGSYLRSQFADQNVANKYAFDSLYTTTQALAIQDVDRNRFSFKGRYESTSSSEISLNSFNIPEGSVNVTAGGALLVENTDYTVDYNLGRVKILNEGVLASGQPIKVTLGSNSLFNVQTKTLMGSRFDYRVSEDINVGGTILNLTERPLTRKININDEPISNTIAGIDGSFRKEAPIITQLANYLPFYSSNAKSTITVTAEGAKLFPGNSRAITKEGIAYIDDFEGSQTIQDVRSAFAWKLASTPQGQEDLFPEGNLNNNLTYGYNRAHLAWYTIDPLFFSSRNDARTPNHIRNSPSQSNNFSREILETEVFPNKDPEPGIRNILPTLDLAFYPNERGPYNYETVGSAFSSGLNRDGSLSNPESRWGGIMREIISSDFEASNVEFIQFWIMDPFNEQDGNPNHDGGNLYFNIGSISEDILKDSRKSFENGLPIDDSDLNTETTAWGRVSTTQSVVNAFNNDPAVRAFQDVGLDGLNSEKEREFFSNYIDTLRDILDPTVLPNFIDDPSNDDYHYYRGSDYDQQELTILERYKRFNSHEGNSPTGDQSQEAYPTAATTIPDVEDINQNFNLDRTESYYQYRVELSPEMLQPDNVGNNFITDVIRTTKRENNGELKEVNWYQFKIPIRQPEKRVGEIRDFKSIRFMRMFLKGFNEEVIVRFARLGFVRGEWRSFLGEEGSTGDTHGFEPGSTVFNIGAVNLEENANRVPINYTIPPDIDREIDFGTTNLRQLNEQSLSLEVCDLQDGFSKFAFRSLNLDVRQYGKLKMFAHAEAGGDGSVLNDNDVSVVIRLGTDFQNNYYEYEVPLAVTFPGQNLPDQVWPESNEIDLPFDRLVNVKQNRNRLSITPGNGVSITRTYEAQDGKNIIRVKGNPNLGEVRMIMIGVKNPKAGPGNLNDDGQPKCAEVWVNELRLSDFNNKGGWAATARMTAQIADLGSVNLSGTYSTPGWGSLEQKLNERQRETRQQYDLVASLDLAKLLPEEANVSIPMYYSVSESIVRPQFNPLDPDIELQELLSSDELTTEYKDSIRKITDDYTLRRSINFTNVRKLPGPNKTKQNFYDVENFSFTYAYSEIFNRSINTKTDRLKTYRGAINYNFTGKEKSLEPFKKVQFFQANKAFQLIQDINLNFVPSQVSIQNSFDRTYHERQARNITSSGFAFESPPFHQKSFNWSRMYSLRHRFTKSLTFNFTANNRSLINEPQGQVNPDDDTFFGEFNNEIWNNISRFGDNTNYNHNFDFSYNLPLNKIPGLDFINASSRYAATYSWDVIGNPRDTVSLGSRIQNSATLGLQGTLNMDMLYNKFQYVQDLKNPNIDNRYTYKEDIDKKEKKERKEKKKEERRQKREDKKKKGDTPESESEEKSPESETIENAEQAKKATEKLTNKKEEDKEPDTTEQKKFFVKRYLMDNVIWSIMSLKTISANYSETQGTILPNYNQNSELLGMSNNFNAPGIDFVSGIQEEGEGFLNRARDNEWLVDGIFVSGDFQKTYSKNYSIRATIRPIDGLRIQLTANKSVSENVSRFFFFDDDIDSLTGEFIGYNFDAPPIVSGNYSMSFLSFNTTFKEIDEKTFENETFNTFRENREVISRRLQETNVNSRGFAQDSLGGEYADGFGSTSQQVLLYSFLSAYSGEDASRFSITDFTKLIPKPNWNITYDGLSKLPFFKKYFKSITLGHAYRSTFSVGSYTRNQVFGVSEENGDPNVRDNNNNFITERQLSNVSISESFSPLLNIDMTWNNSLITRIEFRRDRNISLAFANNQITEILGLEYIIGLGYRIADFVLPFRINNVQKSSDLDLRADISLRDNQTIIRRVDQSNNDLTSGQLTAGQRIFSIKFTADYRFSRKLNFSFYYDRVANTPRISSSFPTANTTTGFRIRFSLAQ